MIGSNLTIFRKGLLLVGLPFALQLIFLGMLLHLQAQSNEADRWAMHTKDVIALTEETYRLLAEAVGRMRGMVVTGNPDFSPQLAGIEQRILPNLDRLEALVHDNPAQVERIHEFRAGANDMLKWLASQQELVRAGNTREAAAQVTNLNGERTVRDVRDQLRQILAEEQRLDDSRLSRVESTRRQTYWFIGAAAAGTILLAAIALVIFTRGIASRLAALAENAARLADRRPLNYQAEGEDEIGQVGKAFASAATRLAEADAAERRYRDELERRANELAATNAELGRTNEDLKFKTQENETFVYSVSHDLRSPLVNLQGFGKELANACQELRATAQDQGVPPATRDHMTQLIDHDVLESVRFIQTAVTRSGNIIDALLRLSRAGRVEYKRQRVDVRPIVDRVIAAMQVNVRQRKAEIVVHDLPEAEGDATAIDQVFGNLLGNAINYLDANRPGKIEVGTIPIPDKNGKLVRYYVRDNGLGIPAAYLPKMFVAFQRLHGQIAPGEGIGLAWVRRAVERMGGSITVESTEGVGSTFFLTLPAPQNVAPVSHEG